MRLTFTILVLSIFFSQESYARVFDFATQSLSTYFRATGGLLNLQRQAYQPGMPGSVNFSDTNSVNSGFSAEIGLAITKPGFTTRIGAEILYPYSPVGSNGNDAGGPLLNVSSQTYGIIPQIDLEIFLKKKTNYRIYFGAGGGYALTSFKNTVTMTPHGTATYNIGSYVESASGSGIMGQGYLGIEFPAFDNVSMSFDLGYRYLTASSYTANSGYTSPLGTTQPGGPIKNADGSNRTTDLGGAFAAVNFRFYFNQ